MRYTALLLILIVVTQMPALCVDAELPSLAAAAMSDAVTYLTTKIAVGGGYLGRYRIDLETGEFFDQWGEGHATKDQNWVQPPGNPSVGFAFLRAWEATGERQYLDAAVACANSLVYGQLQCGGWDYIVDHSAKGEEQWFYRHNAGSADEAKKRGRNQATFDDNVSQHCTRLLMAMDAALLKHTTPEPVARVLAGPAALEFRLVPQRYQMHEADGELVWTDNQAGEQVAWATVLGASEVVFSGADLETPLQMSPAAAPGHPRIEFRFREDKRDAFREWTAANIGRRIAIVVDGQCISAPTIKSAIPGVGIIEMAAVPETVARYGEDYAAIHDAALAALEFVLLSQYDFGGWPQRFPLSSKGYNRYATFNDNSIADCIDVMMIAWRQYGDQRYYDSVLQAGKFIIDAQLPEPQATWAQQYDEDMKPGWARRFEPAAACAGESIGVMRTLIKIALFTGDDKYLQPLPAAFDWYKRSELSVLTGKDEGKWARFYELGTNKPLYFTRDTYRLTYDDSDMPTHYAFKGGWNPASVEKQYAAIMEQGLAQYAEAQKPRPMGAEEKLRRAEGMEGAVRTVVEAQSPGGWWAKGDVIDMAVFERNIQTLASYVGHVKGR